MAPRAAREPGGRDRRTYPRTGPSATDPMDRETLLWALVFSLAPGIGITGFATYVIADGLVEPIALLAGAATSVVLFALVAYAGTFGSADEEREGGTLP